jgi:hypothetical protein
MTHIGEEDLVLLYYGEPGVSRGAREHVAACPECAMRAQSLAAMLDEVTKWPVEEADAGFEGRLWRNVAARLPEAPKRLPRLRFFVLAAAFASVVISAFVAGRLTTHPAAPITAPIISGLSLEARQRVLEISLADHLDRAEILLTNLANGIPPDRGRAADLVSEGRLLRSAVARSGDAGTLALVDDVERFLMEAANQPEHPDDKDAAALRRRIEDDSLVFKIRIIKSNLRTRGQQS